MILQAGELRAAGDKIGKLAVSALKYFIKLQGHQYTGTLAESIGFDVNITEEGMTISFYSEKYGIYVNKGVTAARIPFGGRTGRGGTSKYIQALIGYAKGKLGIGNDKEAARVAFKIAYAHKKGGMPTEKSRVFSKNGQRTNFIQNALDFAEEEIALIISDFTFLFIDIIFTENNPQK